VQLQVSSYTDQKLSEVIKRQIKALLNAEYIKYILFVIVCSICMASPWFEGHGDWGKSVRSPPSPNPSDDWSL